jgi:hypothetical protein
VTITTRVQLHCDVGLKCTKDIARTAEGPSAARVIRHWALANGWGTWGDRDACPECWKELHQPASPGDTEMLARVTDIPKGTEMVARMQAAIDEEDLQRAIALRRGQRTD